MNHDPEKYDRWYRTPRGAWIGRLEYGLLRRLLKPQPHESVLDVGCGTGYFTRCFARDQAAGVVGVDPDAEVAFVREMARVTRRCVAIGLLHRHSLFWLREGRGGGQGGYRGAHWHSRREAVAILAAAGLSSIVVRMALSFPSGNTIARIAECIFPPRWVWGGFLLLTGCVGGEEEID